MPHNDPDPTDPMTLHGVAVATDDPGAMREMATTFIEEFLRQGYRWDEILAMFKVSDYAGPYMAYQAMGAEAIATLVEEMAARWGGRRSPSLVNLPVSEGSH